MRSGDLFPPDPSAGYCGWTRPATGGPWQRVCDAPTEGRCWDLLLAVPSEGRGLDRVVTEAGAHPDRRRRP